ncbi:Os07g0145033 [Oryza sativa Japonica Group]|uniref:Os07g0145033 protein n=1 Tax=Oryza sativa subsp. japonica TaxID=39947 RepID=A0A0P0X2F4_ORYSJ|nr:Os07g0145033 [Oryza sativa Japonica Group]
METSGRNRCMRRRDDDRLPCVSAWTGGRYGRVRRLRWRPAATLVSCDRRACTAAATPGRVQRLRSVGASGFDEESSKAAMARAAAAS